MLALGLLAGAVSKPHKPPPHPPLLPRDLIDFLSAFPAGCPQAACTLVLSPAFPMAYVSLLQTISIPLLNFSRIPQV